MVLVKCHPLSKYDSVRIAFNLLSKTITIAYAFTNQTHKCIHSPAKNKKVPILLSKDKDDVYTPFNTSESPEGLLVKGEHTLTFHGHMEYY